MASATHRRDWEDLSKLDPFWAIVSSRSKQFGGWDIEEFLTSGDAKVRPIIARLDELGLPASRDDALDFGCGAGRLTRALASHFDQCVGVDISPTMVELARELNRDVANCRFEVCTDLAAWPNASFDLVLTMLVLQHLPGREAVLDTLDELVRVLRPGGILIFQLPTHMRWRHRVQPRRRVYRVLRGLRVSPDVLYRRFRLQPIRMTAVPSHQVVRRLERRGAKILVVDTEKDTGGMLSSTYWVSR